MKKIKERLLLLHPFLWPAWLLLGLLWLMTHLPFSLQKRVGHALGMLIYSSSKKLRHITATNIRLCFPDVSEKELQQQVKKNFSSLGLGLIETGMAWWLSDKTLKKCHVTIQGLEHAEAAFAKGKGILLLSPHFACLEMMGRLLGSRYPIAAMYRPHKNKLINFIQKRFRDKYRIQHVARHSMRELLNTFTQNKAVWYAYDIDAGPKRSVFAPFFGIETASLTAVSRIIELTDAVIVPIGFYRMEHQWGYEIRLAPAVTPFPSDSPLVDATRLNHALEQAIRYRPEQYIWQYKRFKTRPEGEKRFY